MAKGKRKRAELSVFKGREAKLNHAIFQILALKSPQTIYDIHKEVKTQRRLRHVRYATVNKRVRALQESGYVKKTGVKKTKAGFKASVYELTAKAYLAMLLDSINLEDLLVHVDEVTTLTILGAIARVSSKRKSFSFT